MEYNHDVSSVFAKITTAVIGRKQAKQGVSSGYAEVPIENLTFLRLKTSHSSDRKHHILPIENLIFFRSLKDIPLKRDEQKARKLMRAYARNVSIAAATDPSIGAAALGITPEGIFKDITTFGLLFESLVIHDLRVYADTIGARVYKYRDAKKREADAVIQFDDGSWALVEVKLGGEDDIAQAAQNLLRIADDIDREKTGKPAFLMVVTKNKTAYRMENGVYVVPLCCLKP